MFFFSVKKNPIINNKTRKNYPIIKKRPKVIVGKIYANWCIHCMNLKPVWKNVIKNTYKKVTPESIRFVSIEETNMQNKLNTFYRKYNIPENLKKSFENIKGYPTIFKIKNGKVIYYNGDRSEKSLSKWVME